ncbi:MAG: glutamate-5-semialdehyde dehydrogenase, partial [Candidatus Binatia bacterium]
MNDSLDVESGIRELCREARVASRALAQASTAQKNAALSAASRNLRRASDRLVEANRRDLASAAALSPAFRDRLTLTPERIEAMARGVDEIVALPDPVGEVIHGWVRPNGLEIRQVRVPLGVVGI